MLDSMNSQSETLTLGRWYSPPRKARSGPVVAATDGTAAGDAAVRAASLLASRLSAKVDVVLVVEPLPLLMPAPSKILEPLVASPEFIDDMRDETVERVSKIAPPGVDWKVDVSYGQPASEIVGYAGKEGAQMIVIGHVHHGMIDKILDGETALQVVRQSSVPILLAASSMKALPKRAVLAVDFSPESMEAAREALRLLDDKAVVMLAHVAPPAATFDGSGLCVDEYEALMLRELGEFADSLAVPEGLLVEKVILHGRPAHALLKLAERAGADLVAVGTRGAGLIQRLFVGTNTSRIVHHSPCSVLIAPRREQEETDSGSALH
jgi:nucleotide-binding universal stress UspA family protein